MADATLVQVLNSADELPIKLGCLLLVEARISDDEVEELAAVGVFHDHEQLLLRLNDLVELDDIGVANFLQNFNFSRNPFNVLLVVDLFFLKDFDGNLK